MNHEWVYRRCGCLHGLRHRAATLASLAGGTDLKVVQDQLG